MNIFEYAGKFHPLAVHMPIGILMVFIVIAFVIPRKQLLESYKIIWLILLVSALSATFSCISGLILSGSESYDAKLTNNHRNLGIALALLNWIIFLTFKKLLQSPLWIYNSSFISILILTIITGHLGGSLTHGSDFLTLPKPGEWFRKSLTSNETASLNSTAFETASLIFEQKCITCHGENKQKGDLRLDTKDGLIKGGKDGNLLGDSKSAGILLERIMLPLEDDDHMPPSEKKQLTSIEIEFLNWWIKSGADLNKTLAELNMPDSLSGLIISGKNDKINNLIPLADVIQADRNTIEKLISFDVLISPIALNSNYLSVSFMNVLPENGLQVIEECIKLKQQIIWLNLDYQNLDTIVWQQIGDLNNLRKLSTKNSNFDDNKMAYLHMLDSLISLNLVGTNVSLSGIEKIKNLQKLESIYLYQTKIDEAGFKQINQFFPKAKLDSGNYNVPIFASDTTVFKL